MEPYPGPEFVIPGMKVGCLPYEALYESTLECFFSARCLNDTARWISSLPPDAWPKPLGGAAMVKFKSKTPVSFILSEIIIDDWKYESNFSRYYGVCAPVQCTYLTNRKNSFLYLMTLLIGLYGGLSIVFRIIAPLLVQYRYLFCCLCKRRPMSKAHNQQGIFFGSMIPV